MADFLGLVMVQGELGRTGHAHTPNTHTETPPKNPKSNLALQEAVVGDTEQSPRSGEANTRSRVRKGPKRYR